MNEAIYWYAVCTIILFLKMFGLSLYQAFHRITKASYKTPEDAAFVGVKPVAEELPEVQRGAKAWLNDLENIPIFFALGAACLWTGAAPGAVAWWFIIFTAARVLHTVSYLAAMQPWRTIFFGVGVVCLVGLAVEILLALP
ncbi:MAPEG family protein [Marinobacter sp.]|uniref:MAPEG family protein n=1 Tax=Marinobacter sp. TaxID=50741 RepID=UPI003850046C